MLGVYLCVSIAVCILPYKSILFYKATIYLYTHTHTHFSLMIVHIHETFRNRLLVFVIIYFRVYTCPLLHLRALFSCINFSYLHFFLSYSLESFSHQYQLMVSHWILSDNKSPGLFLVFWMIITVQPFGWSLFIISFPILRVPLHILRWPYQAHQLQLVS